MAEPVPAGPPADALDLERLTAALGERIDRLDRGARQAQEARLAELGLGYIRAALAQLGLRLDTGARFSPAALAADLGILPKYRRLFERLLTLLAEAGDLSRDGDQWVVRRAEWSVAPVPVDAPKEPAAQLLARCGPRLAAVLRGSQGPLELLFPDGDSNLAAALYRDMPLNTLLADALGALTTGLPVARPLRVLEIGAGTGATAAALLDRLPDGTVEYCFTDIGTGLLSQARQRFADRAGLEFRVLDIEQDPLAQGLAAGAYDLVVAANALHATRDLARGLRHAGWLLRPAGLLLLIEDTRARTWIDLTFGLTDGWWHFTDSDLRRGHPLLDGPGWERLLGELGFSGAAALVQPQLGEAIVVARAPEGAGVDALHGGPALDDPASREYAQPGRAPSSPPAHPRQHLRDDVAVPLKGAVGEPIAFADLPPGERPAAVRRLVARELARVLGHRDAAGLDPRAGLAELGLDSLLALELRNRLQAATGIELPATLAFDHPSLERLASYLASRLGPASAPAAAHRAPLRSDESIAIVGIGLRLPGGIDDLDGLWRLLAAGGDAVAEVPPERIPIDAVYAPDRDRQGHSYCRGAACLDDVAGFDAGLFGIPPGEARHLDPQQRLLLETAWEALERAGVPPKGLTGSRTGVYVGVIESAYGAAAGHAEVYGLTGRNSAFAAGRLAYSLGLTGPALSVNTACSSSLAALHLAVAALRNGECNLALAAGVNVMLGSDDFVALSQVQALAPDGHSKTFSAAADGYGRGEGALTLILQRLSAAKTQQRPILALIRGSAVNHDGASSGITVPSGSSQQQVIRAALADAGLAAADIDAVECHGTGTRLGDPIEVNALDAVYRDGREQALVLTAVKSRLGHLEAGAGLAGLAAQLAALQHRALPGNPQAVPLNPHIDWAALAVRVAPTPTPWPRGTRVRRAGLSAFGFSGTNVHVIIEEPPPVDAPTAADAHATAPLPLLLSGRDRAALRAQAARWADWLDAERRFEPSRAPSPVLAEIKRAAATRRSHLDQRAALLATSATEARRLLRALAEDATHPDLITARAQPVGEVVFCLPGAGSQWPGMGAELLDASAAFRDTIETCDAALASHTGRSVRALLCAHPSAAGAVGAESHIAVELLDPALFAMGLGLAALWTDELGIRPAAVLGQGAGELAAAVLAGALSLADGARLAALLGRRRASDGLAIDRPLEDLDKLRPGAAAIPFYGAANGRRETGTELDARDWLARIASPSRLDAAIDALAADGPRVCIGLGAQPWVGDHRVFATALVPGTAVLELALSAGRTLGCPRLLELDLMAPLVLAETGTLQVQLRIAPSGAEGRRALSLHARGDGQGPFRMHAEGLLAPAADADSTPSLVEWPPAGAQPLDLAGHYAHLAELGLGYGHAFRGLQAAWRSDDDLFAEVALPAVVAAAAPDYGLHPALLDAALHALPIDDGAVLPFAWSGVRLHGTGVERLRVRLRPRRVDMELRVALLACDDRGAPVLEVETLTLRPARPEQLAAERTCDDPAGALYRLDWRPTRLPAASAPTDWWLLGDSPPTLAGVSTWADLDALVDALAEGNPAPRRLLVRVAQAGAAALPERAHRVAAAALTRLRRLLDEPRLAGTALVWITHAAVALPTDAGPADPAQAAVAGLLRSARREYPDRVLRLLDLPLRGADGVTTPPELIAALAADAEPELAWRDGVVLAPRTVPAAQMERTETPIDPARAVLITGAFGGIGRVLARHLVRQQGVRRLVLAGRQGADSAGAGELLTELEALGAEQVVQVACDLADGAQVAALLQAHTPALIFHLAAVLDDGILARLTPERLSRVLAPKLDGAWHLHELTQGPDAPALVLFSSAAGVFGSAGQGAYAAANSAIDALTAARRSQGLPAQSLAWGPWLGAGMGAELSATDQARLQREGYRPLAEADALALLDNALGRPEPLLLPMRRPLRPTAARQPAGRSAPAKQTGVGLAALSGETRRAAVERLVADALIAELGLSAADPLDPDADLNDLGWTR